MKKLWIIISLVVVFGSVLAGCNTGEGAEDQVVKVGLNGSGVPIWEKIKEKAADEGIEIELVEFADYVRPNLALADGDIDLNAFQTVSYFDAFIEERDLDLAPIATTLIAPMGIYSEKYKDVSEIPDGSKIALPKEATNMGRALLLLEKAGLIGLPEDFDGNGSIDKVEENPKNLKLEPIVAGQTPRVLPDVAASIINNGVAVEAGFVPVKDAIFIEDDTATPYINIIASRADETDKEVFKEIVEIYQQEDVATHIRKVYNDSLIPTFVPLDQIGW
ncbi:MetQ/NlpA family ABC transporter substrate-binding protein [Alkalihalobacillus sp. AL-G]|uniref:MetQ/NlpA family ABC transporter substrate-binding protein n=1 Tax=Alkalihalobacillus sp. AL-G TaxID=2926399 RepID=UPI0027296125|nr:MetQ/NlpA family ABC transporter substrate-binding protein [Alkalihalobacillus sp. AL-G]WLD94546.1 MetQ/NlpA family ABC transporter substrate-binding protein [Alkalihalobacillus sp. AL-G]